MTRMLVITAAVVSAFLLVLQPRVVIGNSTATGVDRISMECWETNSGFAIKIRYTASLNRMILANVIDVRGDGHRILRYNVKPGTDTIDWSCKKKRFGNLSRGCVAMHKVTGRRETVASDCDDF